MRHSTHAPVSLAVTVAATVLLAAAAAHARFAPPATSLEVGGGVTDFAHSQYRSMTTAGASWDVSLTVGTRSPVAIELGYVGSAQQLHDPFAPNPTLTTHSLDALARLNLTIWRLQPFLVGGFGWIDFHSYGRDVAPVAQAEFNHSADGLVMPVGGGLAVYFGDHGVVDLRFVYRVVPRSTLSQDVGVYATERPDSWMATLRGGYAF